MGLGNKASEFSYFTTWLVREAQIRNSGYVTRGHYKWYVIERPGHGPRQPPFAAHCRIYTYIYTYIYVYSIYIHICMQAHIIYKFMIYIYIYGTPPQRSTKFNATTDIVGYFRLQDCPEVCWQNLGSRLKPIEPIEISIGTKIQDPRFPGKTPEQSWILDLGSHPRLKFQSV